MSALSLVSPRLRVLNVRDANGAEHGSEDGRFTGQGGGSGDKPAWKPRLAEAGAEPAPERRAEVRGKFEKAPTLEASSDELKRLDKSQGAMKAVIGWAEKKGVLGDHRNEDTGLDEIEVTRGSVRNVIGHAAGDGKLALLAVAPDLIKTGVYLETTRRNEHGLVSHIFAGKARVDGEDYVVGFSVNEDVNGRRYYNHEMTETEKALGPSRPPDPQESAGTCAIREPISNILRKYLSVKSEDGKEGASARPRALNSLHVADASGGKRWKDANGFLHIALRFLRTGLLDYAPSPETFPDGVPAGAVGPAGLVTVLVEPEELRDADSLASLAGMPCLREHDWAGPEKKLDVVGGVAGTPEFDGEYVTGEAVVTDADVIRRLEAGELAEVSAAYVHEVEWTPGTSEGKSFAGKQRNIRYNHFVLLPEGEGRAGRQVRVTNQKEKEVDESKKEGGGYLAVFSRKLGRLVFARNADDAEAVAKADAAEEKPPVKPAEKAANEDGHEEKEVQAADRMLAEIAKLKAVNAELTARIETLEKELSAAKDADKVEAEAEALNSEREEACEVMAANGIDRARALNSIREGKLRGHELRVFAMNSVRKAAGRVAIPEDQAKDAAAVAGMWSVVKDFADRAAETRKIVVGGAAPGRVRAMNAFADARKAQLNALGFATAEK